MPPKTANPHKGQQVTVTKIVKNVKEDIVTNENGKPQKCGVIFKSSNAASFPYTYTTQ